MITLIRFIMKQKLFVNLMVALIIISGFLVLTSINREAFPEVAFDLVVVTTVYPGGSSDELEQLITIPLEKRLREVDDIEKVRSYNIENVSVLIAYIADEASDKKQVVQDIKDAISLESNLPEKAQKPLVKEIKLDKKFIIDLAVFGATPDVPYKRLREMADDIEDYLYDIDGVAQVERIGYRDREYLVEVNPSALEKYRMGMNTVINKLRMRNMDVPGGALRIGDIEYVLRTKGQYKNINEIKNTPLMVNDMGYTTRIKDVARVTDTFEENDVLERFNGREAIVFRIWKKSSADEIVLVDRIQKYIARSKKVIPAEIKLELFNDISRYTRESISSLIINAITGLVLLALVLLVLLGPRMSAIVAIGIPISFMVAFIGMKWSGVTLNVISMFGMVMVLGMIVDFGIVVSENGYRYMEMGMPKKAAILKGVTEVVWPVTVTLLCICAAFGPLLFLTGIMGKFIMAIPIVLMICLCASWFVTMFVMPTHLTLFAKVDKDKNSMKPDVLEGSGFFGSMQARYRKFLTFSVKHRYLTLLILFLMLVASLGLVATKQVKFIFMPSGGSEKITIRTKMPQGTNLKANLREAKKIEKIIMQIPGDERDALHSTIGEETSSPLDPKPGEGTHKSTFEIYLCKEMDRSRIAEEICVELRKKIFSAQKKGLISKVMDIRVEPEKMGPPVGKPVNVEIRGRDFGVIKKIAKEYMDYLKTIDNVYDITMDLEEGKQEFRYVVNDDMATQAGVSVYDIAMALNASFMGAVATNLREGKDDINIRVRFPEGARRQWNSLNKVMMGNRRGGLVPLSLVTNVKKQPGYSQINRLDYKRLVQVQANLDVEKITSQEVNAMLLEKFKDIEKKYPGYFVSYGGEQEDTEESMGEMNVMFMFALMIIYIILAVFFRSLILPVVVMIAIPFAIIGVILSLWIHGEPLSFTSTLGFFSLAGVIVSNTLVLVQFINNKRDSGLSLKDALIEGGVIRLRPVLLTSGTTVLALIPTIYSIGALVGLGGKDYFVSVLGLTFGYGLVFATIITLVLVPCFYHIAEDFKYAFSIALSKFGIKMGGEIYIPLEDDDEEPETLPVVEEEEDEVVNAVLKKGAKKKRKKK